MTSRDFCYWLQGFFELNGSVAGGLTSSQADAIRRHLNLVFLHEIDPSAGPPEHQAALNVAHAAPGNLVTKEQLDAALKEASKQTTHAIHAHDSHKVMRC